MTYKKYRLEDLCEFIKNGKSVQQTKDQKGLPITRIETIANSVIDPAKIKIKNQEKYLAKLAGEYDVGSTSGRGFVHFVTSAARARLALDE